MNPLPSTHRPDCTAATLAKAGGATLFSLVVTALEAWLRVPVQPVLDGYLHAVFARLSSLAAPFLPRLAI